MYLLHYLPYYEFLFFFFCSKLWPIWHFLENLGNYFWNKVNKVAGLLPTPCSAAKVSLSFCIQHQTHKRQFMSWAYGLVNKLDSLWARVIDNIGLHSCFWQHYLETLSLVNFSKVSHELLQAWLSKLTEYWSRIQSSRRKAAGSRDLSVILKHWLLLSLFQAWISEQWCLQAKLMFNPTKHMCKRRQGEHIYLASSQY